MSNAKMRIPKYNARDEYSAWHRVGLPDGCYSTDVDYLESRRDSKNVLYWTAVVETKRNVGRKIQSQPTDFQDKNLKSLSMMLELPYFVIYFQPKTADLPRNITPESYPSTFLIYGYNQQAKELLKKSDVNPGTWISEEKFVKFFSNLPLKTRLPIQGEEK